jgi:serine/threonine-protein kinase
MFQKDLELASESQVEYCLGDIVLSAKESDSVFVNQGEPKRLRLRDWSSARNDGASPPPLAELDVMKGASLHARKLFDYLVDSFVEDYMRKKYALEKAGWRNLTQAAPKMGISYRAMYGRSGGFSPFVNELIRRGVIESRIFPGERGRGGQTSKLRVSYDRRPVQEFVDALVWGKERGDAGNHQLDSLRVAVLPFESLSPDPEDEYLADGLTDEVISALSRIGEIQVISRTSVMQYKTNPKPIRVVAKELNAGTILEATVRKAGNRLRVAVQTIDALTDRHLWSEDYDKDLRDVFMIQSDIARHVAESLKVLLLKTAEEGIEAGYTTNAQAHDLYLRGRYHMNRYTEAGLLNAVKYFELATEEDPGFALAYSGLARCHAALDVPGGEAFPKARKYARKALALEKNLPEGHMCLGMLAVHTWDWPTAERELRRAIELNPSFSEGYKWYGEYLEQTGHPGEALPMLKMAEELDPLSVGPKIWLSMHQFGSGRYDEAKKKSTEAVSIAPLSHLPRMMLGFIFLQEGRLEEGVAEMRKAAELDIWAKGFAYGPLGYAYAIAGMKDEALHVLNGLRRSRARTAYHYEVALVHLGLRQYGLALDHLEKGVASRESVSFPIIRIFPIFDPIKGSPRYAGLLHQMGLSPYEA